MINRGAGRASQAGGRVADRPGLERFFTERPVRIAAGPASAHIPGLGAAVGGPAGRRGRRARRSASPGRRRMPLRPATGYISRIVTVITNAFFLANVPDYSGAQAAGPDSGP